MTTPLDKIRDAHRLSSGRELTPRTARGPFSGFCPAHHDRKRSLSITINGDGIALIHCHAGCLTEDVLRAWGMDFTDLYPSVTDKSPGTVIDVERGITVETESKSTVTKYLELFEQTKAFVDTLPEDYSSGRDEFVDGWKDGWVQVLREWDSIVSLAGHRVRKSPNRDSLDLSGVIFAGCRAAAAAYRTKKSAWDPGAGTMLLTYARDWPRTGVIAAMGAEIKNQINGGDKDYLVSSALEPAGMPPPTEAPPDVVIHVPQAVPEPDRVCLSCHEDISHLRIGASFCSDRCRQRNHRQDWEPEDADDLLVKTIRDLWATGTEDQKVLRNTIGEAAKAIERLRTRVKKLENLVITKPGYAHAEEAASINGRRRLDTQRNLMRSTYEENMRHPVDRELSHRRKTTERELQNDNG